MDKEDTGTTQVCAEKDAVQEILHSLYQQQLQQRQTRNAVGEQQQSRNAGDATIKHGDVSDAHQHVKEDTSDVEMITFSKGIKEASRPQETDHAGDVQRTRLPPWHGLTALEISDSIFFPDGQKEISPAPDRGPQRVSQSYVRVPVPGAYSVSGPFAGQNSNEDQLPEEPQAPIDAAVSREFDEEDFDFIDSAEPRLSSERSRQYWRLRLLRVLSLEVNVVLMAVFAVLHNFGGVYERAQQQQSTNSH
ncbi:expressed unknown protein [Seminavis robusta]|uniref:Transmembrane protein n=1 Tax=Seminavis robusta TaxID=568900 RepID=A0A9N8HTN4_9STRA|nr:expressed unknown protein [Seminavis robusta]|eukprot:Sro1534_g280420.1 n/a (248) ;mRNA; f:2097-2840